MDLQTKIGLGSVQFGLPYGISNTNGKTSNFEVSKILNLAHVFGISTIDTASSYGTSERVIGQNNSDRFQVVSKFMPSIKGGSINNQFKDSVDALKIGKMYGYLAHRPLDLIKNKKDWEQVQILKEDGKINKIGFSLNCPKEYLKLVKADIIPDIVQVPFNYFDSRFKEILILLKEKGCETHTRSTFLQGLFFMNKKDLSTFFRPVFAELDYLQNKYGDTLSSCLLKYALEQPFIDKVILGVENTIQLKESIEGLNTKLELKPTSIQLPNSILMPLNWPK